MTETKEKTLKLEYLKQERQRLEFAHQQLVANVNAHLGVMQWLDEQIAKLESKECEDKTR